MDKLKLTHTEEVKEILQKVPNRYNALITIGLIIFLILLLLLGFFIQMPGKTEAVVKITSMNPPIILKAQASGRLQFLINSIPNTCEKGEYIAMIDNPANHVDVIFLKKIISQFDLSQVESIIDNLFFVDLSLGVIENSYFRFRNSLQEYSFLQKDSRYEFEIKLLVTKIENDSIMLLHKQQIFQNNKHENAIIHERASTDSILFSQNVILRDEYNRTLMSKMESDNKITSSTLDIYNIKQNIINTKLEKQKVEIEYERKMKEATYNVLAALQNLRTSIKQWENDFIFLSPEQNGIVELMDLISAGDFVTEGQALFGIVFEKNSYHGIAILSPEGAGEVKSGQAVNIKLDLYPFQEYGTIDGVVSFITKNSIENNYLVNIDLPKNLISTNNIELAFAETMSGKAEIITENRRLIEVIFYHIKKLLTPEKKIKKNTPNEKDMQK